MKMTVNYLSCLFNFVITVTFEYFCFFLTCYHLSTIKDIDEFCERENPYGHIMMKRLTGGDNGRVDHMLQVSNDFILNLLSYYFI